MQSAESRKLTKPWVVGLATTNNLSALEALAERVEQVAKN